MAKRWKPELQEPPPCRYFTAIQFDDLQIFFKIRPHLSALFGPVDYDSEAIGLKPIPAHPGEMTRRHARVLSYGRPSGREEIVDLTKRVLTIREETQSEGRPKFDIDVAYLTEYSVIRSSMTDGFHSVYMYGGIYAEPICYFEKFAFHGFEHTVPFYRQKEMLLILSDLRILLTGGNRG
jgi:hypothetical protein